MECIIDLLYGRKSYSITELCDFVGISRTAYYNIISGKQIPTIVVADLICKYFRLKFNVIDLTIYDLWRF